MPLEVDSPFNLPMTDAKKYWDGKVAVSHAEYKAMSAEAKVQAFAAAEIAKGEELYTVQRAINRAIAEGTTLKQFKEDAAEIFARRGWDKDKPYRIDLIFRNNVQTAYAVGQWEEINTGNLFPYVQYSSINDSRRTQICKRLSGKIWRREDPALDTVAPLNHHQCRSSLIGRTKGSIKREGGGVQEGLPDLKENEQPGEGFDVNPGKVAYGGQLDNYRKSVDKWPDTLARKSTAESVSGDFFQEWAKKPKGEFPVAVAPEAVATQVGVETKAISAVADQVNVALSSGVPAADYTKVQAVLDVGTWDMTTTGWIVKNGEQVVEIAQDGIGAPMTITRFEM
jgi:SPP1 gp7 family putative phage head morphogenesis protein